MTVRITIDGQIVFVKHHTPILKVAKRLGISIPTLCYHGGLEPYGSCRLCLVEIVQNGRTKLVTSCNYPAENGLEVYTATERVKHARRVVMELLLARCPDAPDIQKLAKKMGVTAARFEKKGDRHCILCGLCVRACEEMVGASAIGFANRGIEKEVGTPFGLDSNVCIGCGTCTYICPTRCVEMVGKPGFPISRKMHMDALHLEPCPNQYRCESCPIDLKFIEEMKRVVEEFRSQV